MQSFGVASLLVEGYACAILDDSCAAHQIAANEQSTNEADEALEWVFHGFGTFGDSCRTIFGNAVKHLAAKSKLLRSESRQDFRLDRTTETLDEFRYELLYRGAFWRAGNVNGKQYQELPAEYKRNTLKL